MTRFATCIIKLVYYVDYSTFKVHLKQTLYKNLNSNRCHISDALIFYTWLLVSVVSSGNYANANADLKIIPAKTQNYIHLSYIKIR